MSEIPERPVIDDAGDPEKDELGDTIYRRYMTPDEIKERADLNMRVTSGYLTRDGRNGCRRW